MEAALDVVAVGELNPDLVLSGIGAPEPRLGVEHIAGGCQLVLGSSTAISAVLMRRLGLRVAMVARVGDDEHGRFCREALRADGVEAEAVVTDQAHVTGLTVSLAYPRDRLLVTHPGAMLTLSAADVPRALLKRARHLHSASFFLQPSLRDGLAALFAEARQLGLTTSLDPGWDPAGSWLDVSLRATLAETDTLLVNRPELAALSDSDGLDTGAERLLDLGAREVVVKQGGEGAAYFSRDQRVAAEAWAVEVVDTTGAGDAFNAGYLSARLRKETIADRLRFANACGALTVGAVGGTGGLRDRAMVDAFARAVLR